MVVCVDGAGKEGPAVGGGRVPSAVHAGGAGEIVQLLGGTPDPEQSFI